MADKHFYRFPTMDFFGKSMPGVLFTLFSISLLPAQLITENEFITSISLAVVITGIFTVIVVGFTVGQGLNTLTIVIQKLFYWFGLNVYRLLHLAGFQDYRYWTELKLNREMDQEQQNGKETETDGESTVAEREMGNETPEDGGKTVSYGEGTDSTENSVTQSEQTIARTLYLRTKFWIWMRYLNFKPIFIPHRTAFENRLQRHMAEERPEEYPNVELLRDRYNAMTAELGESAPPFPSEGKTVYDVEVSGDLYPLMSSYLTQQGITRSQRHKALYVFCRNTTNVLFLFALAYTFMALAPFFFNHLLTSGPDTYIATLVSVEFKDMINIKIHHLSLLLLAASVNFMYASGEYKRYYIEYMIADFNHAAPKREKNGKSD